MISFNLPCISHSINPTNLKVQFNDNNQIINYTLLKYINQVKEKINKYSDEWDSIKKCTNPFEYIHTPYPNSKLPICKLKPLSRAFFKFIEIINIFDIFKVYEDKPITSFHLAEGPGGFIEAIQLMRMNKQDKYYGMTLINDINSNIPGWKKSQQFLQKHPNIIIETGIDGIGDLYNPENFEYCRNTYGNSMDIITGDGGFDFSVDFNKQEDLAFRLILSQVAYAVVMQKKGGTFILKMFDTFTQPSIDIIYILSSFYNTVQIIKPETSRSANSEKYVVCMDFKNQCTDAIAHKLHDIIAVLNNMNLKGISISTILNVPINNFFLSSIENINAILGQQQLENIRLTLKYIENKERKGERLGHLSNKNIQKCIKWCIKYNLPYNKISNSGNIFLNSSKKLFTS